MEFNVNEFQVKLNLKQIERKAAKKILRIFTNTAKIECFCRILRRFPPTTLGEENSSCELSYRLMNIKKQ